MPKLTPQERTAIWILLVLILGGAVGRAWLRHRPPATPAAAQTASSATPAGPTPSPR